MSKIGLNMSSTNSVENLLNRTRGYGTIELFTPQKDAFIDEHTRLSSHDMERAQELHDRLGVTSIENIIGFTFKEKSFLLQAFTHAR